MIISTGKWIIITGVAIAFIGLLITLAPKIGIPFGKLPGDIQMEKEKFTLFVPIVSSLVISVVLTILINLIFWFFRK